MTRPTVASISRRDRVHMLLAVLVIASLFAPAARAAATPDRATLTRMDRVIRDGMKRSDIPGLAIAVLSGDRVVHARGFGDAGGDET